MEEHERAVLGSRFESQVSEPIRLVLKQSYENMSAHLDINNFSLLRDESESLKTLADAQLHNFTSPPA